MAQAQHDVAPLKFVDLFCGGGFGARGAVNGYGTPILGVDSWSLAVETYSDNFPEADVICSPVEALKPKQLAKSYRADVLLTSPECTAHSIARGAKPGCENSRETALEIFPWLDAIKPRWLIVENVSRMKQWDRHLEIVEGIRQRGYSISELYLNAADFGTPQSRKRLFLMCDRAGSHVSKEELIASHRRKPKSAVSIIDASGQFRSQPLYKPGRAAGTLERAERAIAELGRGVDFIVVYYGSDYAGGWQTLDAPLRTVTTLDRFGLVTWKNDEPHLRMLQPSELSKAMGAGSKHALDRGTRRDKIKLCGNGVCSPVMESLFRHMYKHQNCD